MVGELNFGNLAVETARDTHAPVGVPPNLPPTFAEDTRPVEPAIFTRTFAIPGTLNLS